MFTAPTVCAFWNQFSIKLAIDIIVEVWNDVMKACLLGVYILPDLVHDSEGPEPS